MGFFSKVQQQDSERVYLKEVKPFLKEKDGLTHMVMINSFSKWLNNVFCCENKFTTQIDEILIDMQQDGYEIIDVKFNSLANQGMTGSAEMFHTLIIYK